MKQDAKEMHLCAKVGRTPERNFEQPPYVCIYIYTCSYICGCRADIVCVYLCVEISMY